MKSLEDFYHEVMEDPVKLARFFKFAWVSAYLMLLLGFFMIILVFCIST